MQNVSVLVVEPNDKVACQISGTLTGQGATVHWCASRAAASAKLGECGIELLLTELELPDGSGVSLLAEVSAMRRSISSVVMSARFTVLQVVEALRFGASDVVFKPVTHHGLLVALQRAIAQRTDRHRTEWTVQPQPHVPAAAPSEQELGVTIPLTGNYDFVQQHLVSQVIRRFDGNKAAAARALGMHRRTLYRLLAR